MDYQTKDSGVREEYTSGMRRDVQTDKPRFDLLFPQDMPYEKQPLTRLASLLYRGVEKYGERNWELANTSEELERFKASASRHLIQWICDEQDEDHGAAVMFNIIAAMYVEWNMQTNG